MGSSHGAGLYLILVLVFMCEATEDGLRREMKPEDQQPHLQRPMIYDKASSETVITQPENTNFHPEDIPRVPPRFFLRSIGHFTGPDIHFPPAFPSISNLEDICQFSKASVRYPKHMFRPGVFQSEQRQADAVNRLQGWYGVCCGIGGSKAEKICCAEQAWRKTLSDFCFEEVTIKNVPDVCCQKKGKAKWKCFDKEASATSYDIPILDSNVDIPRKLQGFKYNPKYCKG